SISLNGTNKGNFTYDANGNLIASDGPDGRTITFDNFDRPIKVVMGTTATEFRYAPDGSRHLQHTTTSADSKTVYYFDKDYELVNWASRPDEEKTYVGPATVAYQSGSTRDIRYLLLDRLGSVEAVTTASGMEYAADGHSFDAFGK